MSKREIKALAICNVLKDLIIQVNDQELQELGLTKGMMHLVSEAEQQKLLDHFADREKTVEMGGSGANMIRTLAILGEKVSQAGMVGQDEYGELCLNRVQELGIKNNIQQHPEGSTGTSIILASADGERTMHTCLGSSRAYTTDDIPETDIGASEYLIVTGYQWDTDNQIKAIQHAVEVAKAQNTKIVFDLSDPFCVDRHRETFLDLLEHSVDVVFANRKEAEMLTGKGPEESLAQLAQLSEVVVIKCGSKGSWIQSGAEKVFVPCNEVKVVDTTAAGDMYAGGFLFGLLSDKSLEDCGKVANYCAEAVIQNIGARIPEDLRARVDAYLAQDAAMQVA